MKQLARRSIVFVFIPLPPSRVFDRHRSSSFLQGSGEASRVVESPLIFPSFASHSIVTLNERLLDSFHNALMVPGVKIGSRFSLSAVVDLYSLPAHSTSFIVSVHTEKCDVVVSEIKLHSTVLPLNSFHSPFLSIFFSSLSFRISPFG